MYIPDLFPSELPTVTHIKVNGDSKYVRSAELSYDDIVELAYGRQMVEQGVIFSVTFHRGDEAKPDGILHPGKGVKVKADMIISCCHTGNA